MTEPRTPANPEPVGPADEAAPRPDAASSWAPEQRTPGPWAPSPAAPPWMTAGQPGFPAPGPAQPWFGPPANPPVERKAPLLARLPGAVVAAAAAGLLVIGVAGGFGVARATESTAATTDTATTTQLGGTGTGTGTGTGGTGNGGTGNGGTGTGSRLGAGTVGTISTLQGASFTMQTTAGQDVTVVTDSATQIRAAAGTTVDALEVGDVVMVRGTTAQDGSVAATLVVQGVLRGAPGVTTAAPSTTTEGTTT